MIGTAAPDLIVPYDRQRAVSDFRKALTVKKTAYTQRISHETKEEIIGKNYSIFIRPDMRGEAITFFDRQLAQNTNNIYSEYPILTKSGYEIRLGQNTQLIIKNGKAIGFQAVSRDITKKKRREEALRSSENKYRKLSIIDDLTRLYNSRYFYVQLKKEIERSNRYGQPLALLLLDIDNFKQFNDNGHVEGDQVLLRFDQIAKRCLRQTDSAYRYGGEEFTIILPLTTGKNATFTAERIRADFKRESFYQESTPDNHLTVSTGLAQYKTNENMIAFVNRVDQLMYRAKQQGKDRICHEEQWQNGSDN